MPFRCAASTTDWREASVTVPSVSHIPFPDMALHSGAPATRVSPGSGAWNWTLVPRTHVVASRYQMAPAPSWRHAVTATPLPGPPALSSSMADTFRPYGPAGRGERLVVGAR